MSREIISPLGTDKARALLESVFVITPALDSALRTLEKTAHTCLLISGSAGSGRSTMAAMASCVLYHRGLLRSKQPMALHALDLKANPALLRSSLGAAAREGRLLIIDEADSLSLFPEEAVRPLLKALQQPGAYLALLVHDKMLTALEQLLEEDLAAMERLQAPLYRGPELGDVMRQLAQKRWHTLTEEGRQTLIALSGDNQSTITDAVKLFTAMTAALHSRCVRQSVPEGSQKSRSITAEDVHRAWETVHSNVSIDA